MAARGPRGPYKLTPEVTRQIASLIRGGNFIETAAVIAGVSKDTLYDWLKKGREPKASRIYRDFVRAIERAEAEGELLLVTAVKDAGKKDLRALLWRLERRYRRWAASGGEGRVTVETPGEKGGGTKVVIEYVNDWRNAGTES